MGCEKVARTLSDQSYQIDPETLIRRKGWLDRIRTEFNSYPSSLLVCLVDCTPLSLYLDMQSDFASIKFVACSTRIFNSSLNKSAFDYLH